MGTWIEMSALILLFQASVRRSLQWERGLKFFKPLHNLRCLIGRSLQWERGLKFPDNILLPPIVLSFPAMGTWIEILVTPSIGSSTLSFPAMGTWIEILSITLISRTHTSFPAMGTWIEIARLQSGLQAESCRSLQWERGLK